MSTFSCASTMAANSAESSPEMHRITCPHCQKRLKIPQQLVSKKSLRCPKCSQPISFHDHQSETHPTAAPARLADTLPYTPVPQSNAANELDYLTDYKPAGPGIRFLAAWIDIFVFDVIGLVLMAVMAALLFIILKLTSLSPLVSSEAYDSIGGFCTAIFQMGWNFFLGGNMGLWTDMILLGIGYFVCLALGTFTFWYFGCYVLTGPWQATIGKKMLGLIVVDESGHRLTKKQATLRWFSRLAGMCCFCLGFLGIQKYPFQTWYDRLAKTQVLRRVEEYHA